MKLEGPEGVVIHCCICLNQGRRVAAETVVKGYAVCDAHVTPVSRADFDIHHLRADSRSV